MHAITRDETLELPQVEAAGRWLVFGMGHTGLSVARFLMGEGRAVRVIDTREAPPMRAAIEAMPGIECLCGEPAPEVLADIDAVVVSPGVPLDHPLLLAAQASGLPVFGDLEIFARVAPAPYVAITGSNGKSTVTTLVAEIIAADRHRVKAGANLGTPALDLLEPPVPAFFVLETSSFQLELTETLAPAVACILNITPDHLDRHQSFEAYRAAKARVLAHAHTAVLNADDPAVASLAPRDIPVRFVSLSAPGPGVYSVVARDGVRYLVHGEEDLMPVDALRIQGAHNEFNALAAMAITDALGISRTAQRTVLGTFEGLPHRCRLIAERAGVSWIDDSKGTNIGASVAAIGGIFATRQGVLIAGGQGKGADFRELRAAVQGRVHTVVLIGVDAPLIAEALEDLVTLYRADSMTEAVRMAAGAARSGEAVLLSPACASLDMFENYQARGRAFETAVQALELS
jgi:UDP-N-acetylmuramoylalanine--D-glutamate ligase